MKLDLEPLKTFFSEDTTPKVFGKLLDEFLHNYITMLIRIQLSDYEDKTIHQETDQFIFYIKMLKDILPECEK